MRPRWQAVAKWPSFRRSVAGGGASPARGTRQRSAESAEGAPSIDHADRDVRIGWFPLRDPEASKHRIPYMLKPGGRTRVVVSQARVSTGGLKRPSDPHLAKR